MGGKPDRHTAPDMRKAENKAKYGSVENRDKTAPRGKQNPNTGKPQPAPKAAATVQPTAILPPMIPARPAPKKGR